MKVGFLSIEKQTVDRREAQIALFDCGNSGEIFLTVSDEADIEWAVSQLRTVCDLIVVEGNTALFYNAYQDRLPSSPEHFELDGKLYSVTPSANKEYVENKLIPLINSKNKRAMYEVAVFKTYGKSVDELKAILKDFIKSRSKIQFGFFPQHLECEIHARCSANMKKITLNEISEKLNELLYNFTYSYERVSIAERVAELLVRHGLKLKIAESFTGGALAQAFTSLAGASGYLTEGLVTYSNDAKINRLGVPREVIAEKGAVSSDVAYNMAAGLIASGDCDISVSTTGNAGPTAAGGAVGLCYIAIGDAREVHIVKYNFGGDRENNIESGVKNALFLLYEYLVCYGAKPTQPQG